MHMADALISPAVGGALWIAAAGLTAVCARRVRAALDERAVPLMGVLGAFVFAAQMINFSIPLTGSSGHLGGGLLLAILLGPHAAFLTVASILTVQALFFADGGILALGCNLVNLGFIPCFIAYPIYSIIARRPTGSADILSALPPGARASSPALESSGSIRNPQSAIRNHFAAVAAAVVALQLGALGVVLETVASGRAAIPFAAFALFMQPIHLAIGLVEGLVTAAVVAFVFRARPELRDLRVNRSLPPEATVVAHAIHHRRVLAGFALAALLIAGVFSWFASTHPDGLEWSLARVAAAPPARAAKASVINLGNSASGLLGSALTLGLIALCGLALRRRKRE